MRGLRGGRRGRGRRVGPGGRAGAAAGRAAARRPAPGHERLRRLPAPPAERPRAGRRARLEPRRVGLRHADRGERRQGFHRQGRAVGERGLRPAGMKRRTLVLAGAAGLACAVGATWLVLTSDHEDNKVATLALALTAGVSFIASGLIAAWRRPENRTGLLLAAVGYLWALGALNESNNDWLFTAGVALGGLAFGAFAHLLLAFPGGLLQTRLDRVLVASAYAVTFFGSVAVLLVDE